MKLDISSDELYQLYVVEGLTDGEIAQRFSTYQVKISRLRAEHGIPTLLKSDRRTLPETLPPRLLSILIGSMLGDGGLRRTGSETAGYVEHHSVDQRAYLDWKSKEWGSFVSSTIPSNKGAHAGYRLLTHGCRALFPYWRLFYPDGKGDKTFVGLDPTQVDDLALAVWFMDDGSRTANYVRFAVSPDKANQRMLLRVLRTHGLKASLYETTGDTSIHIQGGSSLTRFVDKVSPCMPPCMAYKLEVNPRRAGPLPRDILVEAKIQPLVERGLSAGQIGEIFNVSRQSVLRAMGRFGLAKKPPCRPKANSRKEFTSDEASAALKSLDPKRSSYVDEAVSILSRTEIPLVAATDEAVAKDVLRLKRAATQIEGTTIIKTSNAGALTCLRFFPHRWDACYRDNPSLRAAWYDPTLLRRAIQFQLRVGDPVTPTRVMRAIQAVVRAPTNFRPCFAKALVEAYCPLGGLVLDPCAGYGGRAAGTLAAGRRYFGIDPHPSATSSFQALFQAFGDPSARFTNAPFEDVLLDDVLADCVLTSPPYFSVERYSNDPTQSWVRYKTWTTWVEEFLTPFARKSFQVLREGGVFCVNTKNVRVGRQEFPIVDELARIARVLGFTLERTLELPLGRIGKEAKFEPILVLRK